MWRMDERPEQRPEGALIASALKRSRMSQRAAAVKAGISENRLRAIVHGYQNVGAGSYIAVRGPADTVARIASAVGVTPAQLEEAGREDAAEELRILEAEELRASGQRSDDNDVISIRRKDLIQLLEAAERLAQGLPPDESSAEGDESAG